MKRGSALYAGWASMIAVALLIGLKSFAYWQSGSVSILASLTDSLMDAAVSLMNLMAIVYSLKPADREHRYGHGKIEGLAALFQAAFIAGAGVFLTFESLRRFAGPAEGGEEGFAVIAIMVVSVILSLALTAIQRRSLKDAPSLAVESDIAHYSGDIVINGGVVAVLLALHWGAPPWIDPLFAAGVALYLGYTAKTVAAKGLDMLMDRELPDDNRARILETVSRNPAVRGVHDLRTRASGMDIHIAFDIELDPEQSLKQAHDVVIALERDLLALFPNAEIMIHMDPAGIRHTDSRHHVRGVHDG